MSNFKKIVLHIPHSSDILPAGCRWEGNVRQVLDKWTDWHTDTLFFTTNKKVERFVYKWSRLYCDVERLVDDPMESIGQGIAYRKIEDCVRELNESELNAIYQSYNEAKEIFYNMAKEPGTLIIDCHSFPAEFSPGIDICIGYNEDDTKPSQQTIDLVVDHFCKEGYSVGINEPYSNSVCASMDPEKARVKTIMIEVNKAVYLQKDGITPGDKFESVNRLISNLYEKLLD